MTSNDVGGKVKGVRIVSNGFRSSSTSTFSIETVCGRTDGHFTECVITGNKFGEDVYNSHAGCGISGIFAGSVISDNIFDGTTCFGIELVGNNNTITGNTVTLSVADAAIVGGTLFELVSHTETGMCKNNIVSNNVFNIYNDVQQASGPIQAIAAVYQDGTQIRGNRITYTIPGGATVWGNTTGIALGRRGGSDGPLRNVEVTDNVISCSRSNTGIGIHLAGGVSAEAAASGIDWVQHLVVRENTLIGFDLAIGMGNESNNTYCYFYDNRFIGSANSYYGTLPGTGSVLLTATSKQIPTDGFSVFNKTTTTASEVIARLPAAYAYTIPVSASGSYASSITSATGSPVFSLKKNGTEFGTCTFSGTNGSFTVASATAFAVGDVLTIVGPGTPDGTLAGISFSLLLMRYGA
jgi:parallel beta-helix repeat protein